MIDAINPWSGIKVIVDDNLPPNTMVVSRDLFEQLKETASPTEKKEDYIQ